MSSTILYRLLSPAADAKEAGDIVERLRQRALDLPFESVGEIVELTGKDCDYERVDREHPQLWLLLQTRQLLADPLEPLRHHAVIPLHIIAFSCQPGPGCEQANFGLTRYPGMIEVEGGDGCSDCGIETHWDYWSWASFCKTGYACRPEHGGMSNFRRCHSAVLELLRYAQSQGILQHVHDEAGYWDNLQTVAQILGLVPSGA